MTLKETKYKLGQKLWSKNSMPIREVQILGVSMSPNGSMIWYMLSDSDDPRPEHIVDYYYVTSKREVYETAIKTCESRIKQLRKEMEELDNE